MNISAVSFGRVTLINKQRSHQPSRSERQNVDTFERSTNRKPAKKKQQGIHLPKSITSFIAGAAIATTVNHCSQIDIPKPITIPFNSYDTSITEIAEAYNSDADLILAYNGVESEEELAEKVEIEIPAAYDYTQDKINSLQEKLYSDNLSADERDSIQSKILNLQNKQEQQQNIANVYRDGKFIYYHIKDMEEDFINVEKFKDIFDIKDEVIKKHNNIKYSWNSDTPGDSEYRDYRTASLSEGDIIKIPVSGILK